MFRTLLITCLLSLLFSTSMPYASDDPKVIKIAAGNWPPFIGQDLVDFGSVGQTIQKAFASQGYQVEFHFFPWKRAYKKASEGEFVATAVWMFAQDRTEHFYYSDPVGQEKFVFFHLREDDFDWQDITDIEGKHLGGGLGYSYGSEIDTMIEENTVTINRVDSPNQALQLLKYRRVDLVPEERDIGLFTLQKMPLELQEKVTFHPKPFLTNDSYMMFSKSHPQARKLLEVFNEGLKQVNP